MFGLTKRQFLKRSKECLKETGAQILLFRALLDKEFKDGIDSHEAHRQLDNIRKDIETTFSWYEKLNAPSKCISLQQKILNAIIIFHDCVIINSESLVATRIGRHGESQIKFKHSKQELEKFREIFLPLIKEVDLYLQKK